MKAEIVSDIVYELVEYAISLAETYLNEGQLADTLLDVIHKGVHAYEDHTGETLDPFLIKAEQRI